MAFGSPGAVGLDIGASAVRVAHISGGAGSRSLLNFGQAALPAGAVVDGEIRDPGAVSEAIADLWKRTKLRTKRAVIGVANQRVVVRQIDLPYLEEDEFRSSLRFQAADHIPMSVEDAELDFVVIDDYMTQGEEHMMRVLLVAAATDMIESFVSAAAAGGVEASGIDLTPFAVARAVSPAARGESGFAGSEAVVDVGGGVTNILIHHNGESRFVRILLTGGDDLTAQLAEQLGVDPDEAEAVKLDLAAGAGSEQGRAVLERGVDRLVEEIRGSLDYYLSQEDSEPVSSIVLSGGASLTAGLSAKLERALKTRMSRAEPFAGLSVGKSGLTPQQIDQIQPVAAAAIGLALGGLKP